MKYFHINGKIDEILLDKFIEFMNCNQEGDITIIINSGGGKSILATMLIDIININKDRISLVAAGIYSAAFEIFYFSKCYKYIIEHSVGMYHLGYVVDISIAIDGKIKFDEDINIYNNFKLDKAHFVKTFMTKTELRKFNKREDIYFTFKRLTEIFPKALIISNNK